MKDDCINESVKQEALKYKTAEEFEYQGKQRRLDKEMFYDTDLGKLPDSTTRNDLLPRNYIANNDIDGTTIKKGDMVSIVSPRDGKPYNWKITNIKESERQGFRITNEFIYQIIEEAEEWKSEKDFVLKNFTRSIDVWNKIQKDNLIPDGLQSLTKENIKRGYKQFLEPVKKAERLMKKFPDEDIKVFGSTARFKRASLAERKKRHFLEVVGKYPDLDIVVNNPEMSDVIKSALNQIDKNALVNQYIDLYQKVKSGEWKYSQWEEVFEKTWQYNADDVVFKVGKDYFKLTEVGLKWLPGDSDFGKSLEKVARPIREVVSEFYNKAIKPTGLSEQETEEKTGSYM